MFPLLHSVNWVFQTLVISPLSSYSTVLLFSVSSQICVVKIVNVNFIGPVMLMNALVAWRNRYYFPLYLLSESVDRNVDQWQWGLGIQKEHILLRTKMQPFVNSRKLMFYIGPSVVRPWVTENACVRLREQDLASIGKLGIQDSYLCHRNDKDNVSWY